MGEHSGMHTNNLSTSLGPKTFVLGSRATIWASEDVSLCWQMEPSEALHPCSHDSQQSRFFGDFDGWTISISRLLPFVWRWREGMFAICRSESVARIDCPSARVVAHHNDSSLGSWTALQRLEWSYMFVLLIRMTCRLFADAGGTWGLIREEVRTGVGRGKIVKLYKKEDPPVRTFLSIRCKF